MSYCREEGKDQIIFVTKEDHTKPSKAYPQQEEDDDDEAGLIMPDGSINWECPCLGGMATGPCGPEFREAFTCFHYSEADPKGSDCYEQFSKMQACMTEYPTLYNADADKSTEKEIEDMTEESSQEATNDDKS